MPPETRLTITPAAGPLRRALVPSAWLVFEELALTADADSFSSTNARQLADDLSMSKDTAARALNTLIASGLVERTEHRDEATGRFGFIRYRVNTDRAGLRVDAPGDPKPDHVAHTDDTRAPRTTRVSTSRPSPEPIGDRDQLELFGD